jgi:hypothetical protein
MTDKLPEPVAWRIESSYFTNGDYIPAGLAGLQREGLYTADQLRAALAAQAEAHADQLAIYDAAMDALRAEVEALRLYGNSDCTRMADAALDAARAAKGQG